MSCAPSHSRPQERVDAQTRGEAACLARAHDVLARLSGTAREALTVTVSADATARPDVRLGEHFEIRESRANLEITGDSARACLQAAYWLERNTQGHLPYATSRRASLRHRIAMPFDPRAEALTDDYLELLARSGHSGLYVAYHPFIDFNREPIELPLSHILRLRDFVAAPDSAQLVAFLNDLFERAASFGLEGFLYVMEPWGEAEELIAAHPKALGSHREPHLTQPLCLDVPEVSDYLASLAASVVTQFPLLSGLIVMSEDGTTLCDDSCPRSVGTRGARRAALMAALTRGCAQVSPDIALLAYTWWWGDDELEAVAAALADGHLFVSRTSTGAGYTLDEQWSGTPQDVSLIVDGPGPHFVETLRVAEGRLGVLDMVASSNGHELLTIPGMPAPDRYAQKIRTLAALGSAGWVSYDAGGATHGSASRAMLHALWEPELSIEQIVQTVATECFGSTYATQAVAGWRACSAALEHFPVELERVNGGAPRHGAALFALAPLVPFSVAAARGYEPFAQTETSDISAVAHGLWAQLWQDRGVILRHLPALISELRIGVDELIAAAFGAGTSAAATESELAEAAWLCLASGANLLDWWSLLDRARANPEQCAPIATALETIALRERSNCERMRVLVARDDRLFFTAATKYIRPEYVAPSMLAAGLLPLGGSPSDVLDRKIEILATEPFAHHLANWVTT